MIPCYYCEQTGTVWMGDMLVCMSCWQERHTPADKLEPFIETDIRTGKPLNERGWPQEEWANDSSAAK